MTLIPVFRGAVSGGVSNLSSVVTMTFWKTDSTPRPWLELCWIYWVIVVVWVNHSLGDRYRVSNFGDTRPIVFSIRYAMFSVPWQSGLFILWCFLCRDSSFSALSFFGTMVSPLPFCGVNDVSSLSSWPSLTFVFLSADDIKKHAYFARSDSYYGKNWYPSLFDILSRRHWWLEWERVISYW